MRLNGKVAIITGAGSGIGKAAALLFAKEGAEVVLAGRREEKLRETYDEILKNGGNACYFQADVSDENQVKNLMRFASDTCHKIDILYNCAGVGYCSPYVMDSAVKTPTQDFTSIININLKSVFLCCKYVIPYMIQNGGGAILSTSSINAVIGCGADVYSATKGGINAFSRALAVDNAKYHIRVNVVSPAATDTPMIQGIYDKDGFFESVSNAAPIKRIGTPEDVAYAALFLVSDEAAYITGQNLMVDGGLSIS